MAIPRRGQFAGCLIGQCLADAEGHVMEGAQASSCRSYVDVVLRNLKSPGDGGVRLDVRQYTDDSQLARELVLSYVRCGGFDPADYAGRIATLFAERRVVGRGRTCMRAAQRLIKGVPWDEAGEPPPAAGNGTAMRAAPVGLFHYDDPARLIQVAHDQGRITHKDPRCSAGSVAIAGAVALALKPEPIRTGPFLGQVAEWTSHYHREFARHIRQLANLVALPPAMAVVAIAKAGLPPGREPESAWLGISAFVVPSVLWSLYSFLRSPDDYWETVCTAISVGGDVDTTAAMAGAISGARLGLGAIPASAARRLHDRGTWTYDDLVGLASQCYSHKICGG